MYFDKIKADRTLAFFRELRHTKGQWRGVNFTLLPWQEQAISDVFGTVRDNGFRQYTTAYLEIGKKQGKSELAAGTGLCCLTFDDEWGAEVYGCAADRQQAAIVFDVAVSMVEQNSYLRKNVKIIASQRRMVYLPTKSFYQVLSAESYSKHGFNPHCIVFDELHAQPNRGLFDVMTQGSGDARQQPLFFLITTAGDDPDRSSIGWEVHKKAEDVLLGLKNDPTMYAMIYGIDKENKRIWTGRQFETVNEQWDDVEVWRRAWSNKDNWAKVNPSLGHTVTLEKVEDHFAQVQGNYALEKNFRWLRLNCWEQLKATSWIGLDFWDLCKGKINKKALQGRTCYGGLDLSSKIDMTAFVLLFPPDEINKKWIILPHFWIPEDRVQERYETDRVNYPEWVDKGFIQTTKGNVIDYEFVKKKILQLRDVYNIREIGFDPWNAMQVAISLTEEGLVMAEVRQGMRSMSPPMKELEPLIRGKKLIHDGDPVLRWNFGNVKTETDANDNVRPIKGKKIERIDGIIGLINAMNRAMLHKEDTASIYESRGVLIV